MDYFCCLTLAQLQIVNDICEHYEWPTMHIRFDQVICTQDGWHDGINYTNGTYVEIVANVTEESQIILLGAATELEQRIMDAGIPIKVPRADNIEFHVTIGFVNGTAVGSVPDLVEDLNYAVPIWEDLEIVIDPFKGHICTEKRHSIGDDDYSRNYTCITGYS